MTQVRRGSDAASDLSKRQDARTIVLLPVQQTAAGVSGRPVTMLRQLD